MFERFKERPRKVAVIAQEEARHFNHNYIVTEHLLLGPRREDEGVAARVLRPLGVTVETGVLRVEEYVLERFPVVREATVSATGQLMLELEARTVAGFEVIRTLRR